MKKWMWISLTALAILFVGGYSGYKYVLNQAAEKIYEELSNNEDILKEMEKLSKELEVEALAQERTESSNDASAAASTAVETQTNNNPTSEGSEEKNSTVKAADPKPETQSPPPSKEFKSRDEAVKFAMGKFSASEINRFRKMASDGLTAEEKKELKAIAYSKFSAAEIEAVRQAVAK